MHSFLDAKLMAKALRKALAERKIEFSHGDCLELVARQFGLADWNTLAARIAAAGTDRDLPLPEGWFVTGHTERKHYRLGLDPASRGTALIESRFTRDQGIALDDDSYAVLMQSIVAGSYRGKRVRLSASIRTEDADLGSIWMRVDRSQGNVLRFDNMMARRSEGALKGTTGWNERHVVLDVPEEAGSIHYGFLLQGYGRVWARSFRIETVGGEVKPTAGQRSYLPKPTNLDFSGGNHPAT